MAPAELINQIQIIGAIDFERWSWLIPWAFGFSAIVFVGSMIVGRVMLLRMPEDFLTRSRSRKQESQTPVAQVFRSVIRNLVGLGFLGIGIVMLLTPGQGILSIFLGITIMEFPGKQKLLRKILANPKILSIINRIREKADRPPLLSVATSSSM